MELITNIIKHDLNINKYFLNSENSCFIDIETTGLNRNKNMIYLIGLLYNDSNNKWILKQYFANEMSKEKDLLIKFIDDISHFDNLINYNGNSFDIPYINHRLNLYNLNTSIDIDNSFDLYRYIRKNKEFLNLKNLKLKTIEESLGYFRKDIYSGYDCIKFYNEYTKTNNKTLKNYILQHNYDDLVHMLDILEILDVIKNKKSINFNIRNLNHTFLIKNITHNNDIIEIDGLITPDLNIDFKVFQNHFNLNTKNKTYLNLKIPLNNGLLNKNTIASYIDLTDFEFNIQNNIPGLPDHIYILKINNKLIIDNIKNLIFKILNNL